MEEDETNLPRHFLVRRKLKERGAESEKKGASSGKVTRLKWVPAPAEFLHLEFGH